MGIVTVVNFIILGVYWLMDRHLDQKTAALPQEFKKKGNKLSLKESLMHVLMSPSLGCIALMVIGYSISVNMVEVIWKATLKIKYPDSNDYQAFMGVVSSITGCLSLFLSLLHVGQTRNPPAHWCGVHGSY